MPQIYTPSAGSSSVSTPPTSGFSKLLAPCHPMFIQTLGANTGNFISGTRVVAGASGTLHDLTVLIGTASGNLRVGIYDTGDASAGNRSLLYGSGSVAAAGATAFQVVADPNIAVVAGVAYDLVVFPDNNTLSLGRFSQVGVGADVLPTSFLAVPGGASPKTNWAFSLAYAALPATIAEASCGASSSCFWVGGRIV